MNLSSGRRNGAGGTSMRWRIRFVCREWVASGDNFEDGNLLVRNPLKSLTHVGVALPAELVKSLKQLS